MEITSTNNERIKHALQVKETKYIQKYGECFVESEKVIDDLLKQGQVFSTIFVESSKQAKYAKVKCNLYVITRQVSKGISSTVTTDGVFGVLKLKDNSFTLPKGSFLVLDRIQDPANVGAIMRSAVAFGYNEMYLIDCANPFNAKVIRSSMGHVFNVKINNVNEKAFIDIAKKNKFYLVSADMDGEEIGWSPYPKQLGLILGNEGQGISSNLQQICYKKVAIPMSETVESLNVAVSAGILMFNLKK